MTITYRCDRCGGTILPEQFYEVVLLFTPHTMDGGEAPDRETREWIGQVCELCRDATKDLVEEAFESPKPAPAVREDSQ